MSQLINLAALGYTPYAYFSKVTIPHFQVNSVNDINFTLLLETGFKGGIFDKDNTLTKPYQHEVHPSIEENVRTAKNLFPHALLIDSNSAGTRDDPQYNEAKKIEDTLGIPVLHHVHKKPAGGKAIANHFKIDLSELSHYFMIGDRVLTDIAFGNRYGMLTILVNPFTQEGDLQAAAAVRRSEHRRLEQRLFRGERAPPHPLYQPDLCNNVIAYGRT